MSDAIFDSLLNNTFVSFRRDRIPDGQGGWPIAYVQNITFLGRMRPASSAEKETAKREERAISHVLYVVHGEDIERGDWVIGGGIAVDVQGVREPSQAAHHLEIDCMETQREATEVGS
jgi:SPP1 family predicted phage head-tail adaptor